MEKSAQGAYEITLNINLKVLRWFDTSEKQNYTANTFQYVMGRYCHIAGIILDSYFQKYFLTF